MPYNTAQEAREIVGETEFYEFTFGDQVERYVATDRDVVAFGFTWRSLPIVREGVDATTSPSADKSKILLEVRPEFVALIAEAGLSAISVRIVRGFGRTYDGIEYRNPWFTGELVDLTVTTTTASGRLESAQEAFDKTVPGVGYDGGCNNTFGDAICGVDLATLEETRTITAIEEGGRILTLDGAIPTNGAFNRGRIWLPSSPIERRFVLQQAGSQFVLHVPLPGATVGSSVVLIPGCPGTLDACAGYGRLASNVSFPGIVSDNPVLGI